MQLDQGKIRRKQMNKKALIPIVIIAVAAVCIFSR